MTNPRPGSQHLVFLLWWTNRSDGPKENKKILGAPQDIKMWPIIHGRNMVFNTSGRVFFPEPWRKQAEFFFRQFKCSCPTIFHVSTANTFTASSLPSVGLLLGSPRWITKRISGLQRLKFFRATALDQPETYGKIHVGYLPLDEKYHVEAPSITTQMCWKTLEGTWSTYRAKLAEHGPSKSETRPKDGWASLI